MAWQFTAGEILTAANLNAVTIPWNAVCQVYDASQSISDNTSTAITFDTTEDLDPLAWHSTVTNPTRVTPTIGGWYRATGWCRLITATATIARFAVSIGKNGTAVDPQVYDVSPAATSTRHSGGVCSPLIQMNGTTDYLELLVTQDDTGGTARSVESRLLVELAYPT